MPIYNRENILDLPDPEIQFFINDQLFLETLLIEIRGKTISFASYLKKSISIAEQKLTEEIGSLEEEYEMNMGIILLQPHCVVLIKSDKIRTLLLIKSFIYLVVTCFDFIC